MQQPKSFAFLVTDFCLHQAYRFFVPVELRESEPFEQISAAFATVPRRCFAYLIDSFVAFCITMAASLVLQFTRAIAGWNLHPQTSPIEIWHSFGLGSKLLVLLAFAFCNGPVYLAFCEASGWQAGFGKRILGIYVSDNEGKRINIAHALVRSVVKVLQNVYPVVLLVASVVMMMTTRRRKAIHDYAAGTLVLRGHAPGSLEPSRIASALLGQFLLTLVMLLMVTALSV